MLRLDVFLKYVLEYSSTAAQVGCWCVVLVLVPSGIKFWLSTMCPGHRQEVKIYNPPSLTGSSGELFWTCYVSEPTEREKLFAD